MIPVKIPEKNETKDVQSEKIFLCTSHPEADNLLFIGCKWPEFSAWRRRGKKCWGRQISCTESEALVFQSWPSTDEKVILWNWLDTSVSDTGLIVQHGTDSCHRTPLNTVWENEWSQWKINYPQWVHYNIAEHWFVAGSTLRDYNKIICRQLQK